VLMLISLPPLPLHVCFRTARASDSDSSMEARRTTSVPASLASRLGGRIYVEALHGRSGWRGAPSPSARR
jgi:hypothetical protein